MEDDLSSLRDFYQPPTKTKSGDTAVVDSQEAGRIAASIWESIKFVPCSPRLPVSPRD